jgi:hypothetical protein
MKSYVLRDSHIHATNPGMKLSLLYNLNFKKVYINLEKYVVQSCLLGYTAV